MRVGFAGTPEFAAGSLAAIIQAGYTIPLCLTQPDRPKGRGLALEPSPVKALALCSHLPVAQPASLKDPAVARELTGIALDVLVVAAYGLILPAAVLGWPRHGCLNIHASKLPRWRGAAPIARAIEAGDPATGVTIMQMDAGLDTGPVIDAIDVPIDPRETGGTLHDKLAAQGAAAIVATLARLERQGALEATPQPDVGVTYAAKISRSDAIVSWQEPAATIERRIRAFDPVPGMTSLVGGQAVKLWSSETAGAAGDATPGKVLATGSRGIDVACGDGTALRLLEVQPAGGRRMPAAAFAAGRRIEAGSAFGAAAV